MTSLFMLMRLMKNSLEYDSFLNPRVQLVVIEGTIMEKFVVDRHLDLDVILLFLSCFVLFFVLGLWNLFLIFFGGDDLTWL